MRWHVTLIYRTENGPLDIEHHIDEVADVDDLIESGPHWDTLIECKIVRINHVHSETLTVEGAEQL